MRKLFEVGSGDGEDGDVTVQDPLGGTSDPLSNQTEDEGD